MATRQMRRRVNRYRRGLATSAETLESRTLLSVGTINLINTTDVAIPDDGVGGAGVVTSSLVASGAPADAVVTAVTIRYQIKHTYIGDLVVWGTTLESGTPYDHVLWNNEGGSADDIDETESGLTRWNGLSPNRTWSLSADDQVGADVGFIDSFEIWINWATLNDGSISGIVWRDLDSNSTRDAGEPPMSGVTVYLDTNNDQTLDAGETQTTSDATGTYTFLNVPAGTYSVRQVVPGGATQTFPGAGAPPTWASTGPAAVINGQVEGMSAQSNPVTGAVHAVAPHPTDANILYIGAVNGGVWKTTNATAANPTWTPLTDQMGTLSIGALEFDPTDATYNTLVAGVGRFSSLANDGGARVGAYRTTDGGANWTPLAGALVGKNISGVAARGNTIVVSVNFADPFTYDNIGIWRSTNAGVDFARVSGNGPAVAPNGLPGGRAFDLAGDPTNSAVLYCAVRDAGTSSGVYKSVDTGATWTRVSNAAMNALNTDVAPNSTSNIEIAVGNAGQVYAGIMGSNGRLTGLFRSGNGGTSWTQLDTPTTNENGTLVGIQPRAQEYDVAGGQGQIHFSIAADPVDPDIVYVGGDRQPGPGEGPTSWPNSIGATNYTGRLFRVDSALAPGSQAIALTHNPTTTNNSAPHADSRDMAFDAAGNLIQGDDGGIYKRTNASTVGVWTSLIGDLQLTEIHSLDYDRNSNRILAGTQDVGQIRSAGAGPTWNTVAQGDGAVTQIDDSNSGFSYHYYSYVGLQNFFRATVDAFGVTTAVSPVGLQVAGAGMNLIQYDSTRQFYNPYVLNTVAPERMAIGTSRVYVSLDRGDTLTDLGAVTGSVGGLAYGGSQGGVANPNVLYVGTDVDGTSGDVFFRSTSGGALVNRTSYPGGTVKDIVLDPNNWATAYVVDATSVYRTLDAGVTWTNVTGSLANASLRTIEFLDGAAGGLFVGGLGGVYTSPLSELGTWSEVGDNLPNAVVMDLRYDAADDLLVAGTLGRGAWTLSNPSQALSGAFNGAHRVVLAGQAVIGKDFGNFSSNAAPVAAGDSYVVNEDGTLTTSAPGVLANDTDADSDPLTAVLVSGPSNGSLVLNSDGGFEYIPAEQFNGTDSFTYQANDGGANSNVVTVTIAVNAVNDVPRFGLPTNPNPAPVAEDAGARTITGYATSILPGPILATDEAGQVLTFLVTNNNPALFSGQPSIDPLTGDLTFTSAPNAHGSALVTVILSDDGGTANGGVDTSAPQTFTITVTSVNDAPTAAYGPVSPGVGEATANAPYLYFKVIYSDDVSVNYTTIGAGDVQMTGPGGYSQSGTLANLVHSAGAWTATYRVPAPGGTWNFPDNGTYTVSMNASQVADNAGLFVPPGQLGTVVVALADTGTPPTATLSAANLTVPGGIYHYFQVAYQDNVAVQFSTIGSGDVQVTGPGGYSQPGTLANLTHSAGVWTATYRVPAPGGTWDSADNGVYTVAMNASQVSDTAGTFVAAGTLGSFSASFSDSTPPSAVLTASDVTAGGTIYHYLRVAYSDNVAIAFGTIGGDDVLVTGPNGYSQAGSLANLVHSAGTWTATYRVPAAGGAWGAEDNGTYTVSMRPAQVSDTSGNFVAAGVLGTFLVTVPSPPAGDAGLANAASPELGSELTFFLGRLKHARDLLH